MAGLLMHLVNVLAQVRQGGGRQVPMWRTAWSTVWPSGRAPLCWSCTVWQCCPPEGRLQGKQGQESVNNSTSSSSKPGKGCPGSWSLLKEARCCYSNQKKSHCSRARDLPTDHISHKLPEDSSRCFTDTS